MATEQHKDAPGQRLGMTGSTRSVLGPALKMASATFSSRVLGLVREQAMAAIFGASGLTDAFLVANRIPNMLRDLFAEGAFSSAFVPIFTQLKGDDPKEARRLLWSLALLLILVTGTLSALMAIFAPELVSLFAPKFAEDAQKFELTVSLLRLMSPFLVLISLAALFMGALNTLKVFFVPALAPAFFNVVMIACIFSLPPLLTERGVSPVFALGFGVIGGGIIQLLVQLPLIFKKAYGPLGPLKLVSSATKAIVTRVGIGTIGVGATHINIFVSTILATSAGVGAVSWLSYGFRLFQFPVGILGVSLAGSNLVHFSDAWKAGNRERARDVLGSAYFLAWLALIPATVLLYSLSRETISLIFERGAFSREDTQMAALALRMYLIGLPFYGLYKIFSPTFYALDRPKIPVAISSTAVAFNIVFCLFMTPLYGFHMLALGTSLSMLGNIAAQTYMLKRLLPLPWRSFFNLRLLKLLLAGGLSFAAVEFLRVQYPFIDQPFAPKALFFTLYGATGLVVYLIACVVTGEGSAVVALLKRRRK